MNPRHAPLDTPASLTREDLAEHDEVAEVLTALRALAARISHPVVRGCLEQAHEDIAHLTSCGEESPGKADEAAA